MRPNREAEVCALQGKPSGTTALGYGCGDGPRISKIVKSGDYYLVKTKDGKKTLGKHDSRKSAEDQLAAIEAHKHASGREAKEWDESSPYRICNSTLPEGSSEEKFKRCKKKVQESHRSSSRRYRIACMILDEDGHKEGHKDQGTPEEQK